MYTNAATIALAASLFCVSAGLTGCQASAPPNRGQSGYRVDPTHDAPGELGVRAPRSQDLVTATDRMARDLAARLDITDTSNPPVIFVGDIENRSAYPERNMQIFLVRMRSLLQQSGARHGLEFVRQRDYVETQRAREYGRGADADPDGYRSRADYVLTCEIFDLPTGETNYYLFDYQLVQLRPAATGPDVGPGAIVWENSYEVKFQ